jgi:hypothetical protein
VSGLPPSAVQLSLAYPVDVSVKSVRHDKATSVFMPVRMQANDVNMNVARVDYYKVVNYDDFDIGVVEA